MPDTTQIALLAIILVAVVSGCSSNGEIVVRKISSGADVATLSKRNSGAMSSGSTLVSLRGRNVPDDDYHGQIILGLRGDHDVSMQWKDTHHLLLTCKLCAPSDVDLEVIKMWDVFIENGPTLQVKS